MNKYLLDALTLPGDARQAWRTDGARGFCGEIAERTVYRIVRRGQYDLYDRDLSSVRLIEPPPDIEVRLLDASEHSMLNGLMTRRRRAQLERGGPPRTIFAALRDGAVVGYSWWTHEIDALVSFAPLVLPANAVFHGYVHVDRATRHQRVASALFSAGERHLAEQGARLCWFLSRTANVDGARNARARWVGKSRHIARLTYWKLPFRTFRRLTLVDPA